MQCNFFLTYSKVSVKILNVQRKLQVVLANNGWSGYLMVLCNLLALWASNVSISFQMDNAPNHLQFEAHFPLCFLKPASQTHLCLSLSSNSVSTLLARPGVAGRQKAADSCTSSTALWGAPLLIHAVRKRFNNTSLRSKARGNAGLHTQTC